MSVTSQRTLAQKTANCEHWPCNACTRRGAYTAASAYAISDKDGPTPRPDMHSEAYRRQAVQCMHAWQSTHRQHARALVANRGRLRVVSGGVAIASAARARHTSAMPRLQKQANQGQRQRAKAERPHRLHSCTSSTASACADRPSC